MDRQKQEKQCWESFWLKRTSTGLGKILFSVREHFLAKSFIKVAMKHSLRGTVLEAGCGSAISSILLAKRRGDKIIALDISTEALTIAKRLGSKYRIPLKTVQANIQHMPFPNKSIDLCWNIGTIEHFEDPIPILKEMKRVGKVNICIVPAQSIIWKLFETTLKVLKLKEQEYFRLYTSSELRSLFESIRYEQVKIEKIYTLFCFPYIAAVGTERNK